MTHRDLCPLNSDLENPAGVGYKELAESIHAEISIASYFKKQGDSAKKQNDTIIAIGVSKRVCFLCYHYLRSLSCNERLKFAVSGYHRKVPATWRAPPADTDGEIEGAEMAVRTAVTTALDTIVARVLRRKSDSAELEDSTLDREVMKEFQAKVGANIFDDDE